MKRVGLTIIADYRKFRAEMQFPLNLLTCYWHILLNWGMKDKADIEEFQRINKNENKI
jgi:hypothetical protein